MKTITIKVPENLHKAIRIAAITADMTTKEYITQVLAEKVGVPITDEDESK